MINIAKILENVPKGTKLYSPLIGECIFIEVNYNYSNPIRVKFDDSESVYFTKDGKYLSGKYGANGECLLFPSKGNRDWNEFQVEEKFYKFEPFDKVLVRNRLSDKWTCNYFSHMTANSYYACISNIWNYCIPYDDSTKHLVGTNKSL